MSAFRHAGDQRLRPQSGRLRNVRFRFQLRQNCHSAVGWKVGAYECPILGGKRNVWFCEEEERSGQSPSAERWPPILVMFNEPFPQARLQIGHGLIFAQKLLEVHHAPVLALVAESNLIYFFWSH